MEATRTEEATEQKEENNANLQQKICRKISATLVNGFKSSSGGEAISLLPPVEFQQTRPRLNSVFFMSDSKFCGGILARNGYMVRCYESIWRKNGRQTEHLKNCSWSCGDSKPVTTSKQNSNLAFGILLLQWIIPMSPLPVFACPNSNIDHDIVKIMLWLLFILQFAAFLWYFVIFNICYYNWKLWKDSLFTFEVPKGAIGLIETRSSDLTFFYEGANIRFLTVKPQSLSRISTISLHDQLKLAKFMTSNGLEEMEIILYTDAFIECYSNWPRHLDTAGIGS